MFLLNRTGVTVTNGTVRGFDIGVAIDGGSGNTVSRITARDNIGGVGTIGGDGIAIMSSSGNRILNNQAINNAPFSGIGLYSRRDSAHPGTPGPVRNNLIDGNTIQSNKIGRNLVNPADTDNDGIRLENDVAFTTIINNLVSDSGLDGISLFADTADNVVRGNQVTTQRVLPDHGPPGQRDHRLHPLHEECGREQHDDQERRQRYRHPPAHRCVPRSHQQPHRQQHLVRQQRVPVYPQRRRSDRAST